jgi:hypothetical protein
MAGKNMYPLIARLTGRNVAVVQATAEQILPPSGFADDRGLGQLWEGLRLVELRRLVRLSQEVDRERSGRILHVTLIGVTNYVDDQCVGRGHMRGGRGPSVRLKPGRYTSAHPH